jgi:DNA-binding transcriptional LysR family regulator
MPSLRALECLVAVADSESITQAARLLHSSQPAVSHQLAALEREAQTILLRREPRGVKLTPAGRAAVAHARRAIDAAASAMRSARAVGEAPGGSLRLACAQSLTVAVLAPVIRMWHRLHPDVAITLREAAVLDEFLGLVDSNEVDMALVPLPVPDRFTTSVVIDEEIVWAAPSRHRLARQP